MSTGQTHSPSAKGALGIIFLIVLTDLMGFGLIIPLLPFYALRYHASPLQVTLLFAIYSFCQFLAAPLLGLLSDRHGRRPVLLFSQFGSIAGYILLGIVTQAHWNNVALALWLVYAARLIDGFSGGNISTAYAYIADITSHDNRAKGMGLIGAAFGIGFAAGPAIGGLLGDSPHRLGYPAFAAAFFSLLAAVLTWRHLPESRRQTTASAETWLHPAHFLPLLRRSSLLQLLLVSFFSMAAFVMLDSAIALYLVKGFNWTPGRIGLLFTFVGLIVATVQGGLIGRLTRLASEWRLNILGAALSALGMIVFAQSHFHSGHVLLLILLGAAVNAVGRSLQQPTLASLISRHCDVHEQGAAFGLSQSLSSLARVVGPIAAGLFYTHHVTGPFLTAALIAALVSLWMLLLWRMEPQTAAPTLSAVQ